MRVRSYFKLYINIQPSVCKGAWVVTGGINGEVTKLVGEALENNRNTLSNPVIGIVPWGCINNRDALINEKVSTFT